MNISLLVSNFSKTPLFEKSLESILPQLTREDEIVVADDSLKYEGMRALLEKTQREHGIKYKYHFTNNIKYRSGVIAKNIALKLCSNPLIIINDPEVYHITRCIDQIKEDLKIDKRLFIVPGTMRFCEDESNTFSMYKVIEHSQAPFIAGVIKSELMDVGGWDERFKFWGNDDNDLMYRLGLNGCQHRVDDAMIAIHQWHSRPPAYAMGDANDSLLNEKPKKIIANEGREWGKI